MAKGFLSMTIMSACLPTSIDPVTCSMHHCLRSADGENIDSDFDVDGPTQCSEVFPCRVLSGDHGFEASPWVGIGGVGWPIASPTDDHSCVHELGDGLPAVYPFGSDGVLGGLRQGIWMPEDW